jgi:hypothetical protein
MANVIEIDAATRIVVERDFTPEELAQREADIAAAEAAEVERQSVIAEKAAARAALLERLGITADEASLLLGA